MLGQLPKQGSNETESQQLMRDLYDSLERENDLKEQMKFTETEAKTIRKKLSDLEEENESLTVQIRKLMSAKTIFTKKSDDVGSAAKEIELNLMLEMSERENAIARRKVAELDHMNDSLQEEVKYLEKRIEEKEQQMNKVPEPTTPNAYYEDKVRELTEQTDDLKWKLIEKDREIERLSALVQNINTKQNRLKKSRSLDGDNQVVDLNRQLNHVQQEASILREKLVKIESENERMVKEHRKLQFQVSRKVPMVKADDAAIENVELKDMVKRLEGDNKDLNSKLRVMSENLRKMCKESFKLPLTSSYTSDALFSPVGNTKIFTASSPRVGSPTATRTDRIGDDASVSGSHGVSINIAGSSSSTTSTSVGSPPPPAAGGADKVPGIPSPVAVNSNQVTSTPSRDAATTASSSSAAVASAAAAAIASANRTKQLEGEASELHRKMAELEAKNSRMSRELNRIRSEKTLGSGVKDNSGSQLTKTSTVDTMSAEDRLRRELMAEIDELEDEINHQQKKLAVVQEQNIKFETEIFELKTELSQVKDQSLQKEKELLTELEMMQDKNDVLSNLLDIVKERADEAERELEKIYSSSSSNKSERSTSNVSVLSDASLGSDEVFLVPPSPGGTRDKHEEDDDIINKDWENQFRKRISCLEVLLAEERSKLSAAEKKLKLTATDIISTGLSDDAKLHMREKELLQQELLEGQKHMRIANDQLMGLKERMEILEEENQRLKDDYKKLEIEMTNDKSREEDGSPGQQRGASEAKIKKLQEEIIEYKLQIKSLEEECAKHNLRADELEYKMTNYKENMEKFSSDCKKYKQQAEELEYKVDEMTNYKENMEKFSSDCKKYKQQAEELEYKVDELNEIWRSKSAASEKEKETIEIRLKGKILDLRSKEDMLLKLQKTVQMKMASLLEKERIIKARDDAIATRDEVIRELEEIAKQRDTDFQTLLEQVSSQDENAKKLRDYLRQRDERLREKDDLLQRLNMSIDKKQDEVKSLDNVVRDSITRLTQKEDELKQLRTHISEVESMKTLSETDEQKENSALKNKFTELLQTVKRLTDDKESLSRDLSLLKNNLNDKETKWQEEKNVLNMKIRTLNERLTNVTKTAMMNEKDSNRILRQDNQNMIEEKNRLNCEIRNLRQEMDEKQRLLDAQAEIGNALEAKRKQVDELVATNNRQQKEIDRLESQATMAFQLQQQERVRKAEQLGMKVRYETKMEKLQRDYNQLLINSERVSKERELQQEIIRGVQRGMFNLKDKYSQDRSRWQTDKQQFEMKATEAEEGQNQVNQLSIKMEKLQLMLEEQERMLSEHANNFATEKSAWEIEKSSIKSDKNQLEERLSRISKSSKDEVMSKKVWEKERFEQKRLLTEAHKLAMDLQQQLKSRDEAYSKERKQILNRLESERATWERKKIELEKRIVGMESCGRQLTDLQNKYQEIQETSIKEQQNWLIEKNELVRQVAEQRQRLAKDSRKIEDVLYQLNHIKSLFEQNDNSSEGEINANLVSRSSKTASQILPAHVQELQVSIIIHTMAEDLLRYIDRKDREVQSQIRRSLSSTQLELHKELENILGTDSSCDLLSPRSAANAGGGITRSHTSDSLQKMTLASSPTDTYLSPYPIPSVRDTDYRISRSPSPSKIDASYKPRPATRSPSRSPLPERTSVSKTLIKSISMDNPEVIFSVSAPKTEHVAVRPPTLSTTSLNLPLSSTLPRVSSPMTTSSASLQTSQSAFVPIRSVSVESVSPLSPRKQFFTTKPTFDYGMSWPRRTAIGHNRQSSMPETTDIRVISNMADVKPTVSWNDSVKVIGSEKPQTAAVTAPTTPTTTTSTEEIAPPKSNVKEKRRLFKKSSSVDSPVASSLAKAGVQAAAPSIMKPSDLFKAMKQKLRPAFKKTLSFDSSPLKPAGGVTTPIGSSASSSLLSLHSPLASTSAPETPSDPMTSISRPETPPSAFQPIPMPDIQIEPTKTQKQKSPHSGEETDRLGRLVATSKQKIFRKNRSKSADSRHEDKLRPMIVHADVITPIRVWEFSETPV